MQGIEHAFLMPLWTEHSSKAKSRRKTRQGREHARTMEMPLAEKKNIEAIPFHGELRIHETLWSLRVVVHRFEEIGPENSGPRKVQPEGAFSPADDKTG
jgi:hypothetical protein